MMAKLQRKTITRREVGRTGRNHYTASKLEESQRAGQLVWLISYLQWPVTLFRAFRGDISRLFSTRDTVDFDTPATLAIP